MKIKVLPQKDLKEFWKIQNQYLDKWTFGFLKKEYSKHPSLYIGCYEAGKLIGIAHGFTKDKIVILQGIAVKHEYWKKGVGKKILSFFEKQAKKLKIKKISVGAAKNVVKFYAKSGYKPVEEKPRFLVMEKEIKD